MENQAEEMVCDVDATVRHYGYDGSPEQIAAKKAEKYKAA